jgi:hypothetical protein
VLGLMKKFDRRIRGERGAALAAVVGLMAVSVMLTAVVASSVITATGVTSSVRAGVQSQAAAEAGIATARLGLVSGTCTARTGRYASAAGATPEFLATIWVPSGSGWTRGCPTGTATQVRILSSGYAAAEGVDGVSGRDQTNIELVLSALAQPTAAPAPTPTTPPVTIVASGPAIYAYNSTGFGGSGKLISLDGSTPSVLVKTGDVTCSGGSSGQADWVIDSGAFAVSGSCNITGTVWVDKGLSVSGGTAIGGSAVAASINVSGSSKINGSAWSAGDIVLSGGGTEIGVNATAGGNLTVGGSAKVKKNTWVQLHTSLDWGSNIGGNATSRTLSVPAYSSGLVTGTVTQTNPNSPGPSPYAQPPRPVVADWIDFGYATSDWVGFTEVVLSGNCDYTKLTAAVASLSGNKGVLDARNCTNAIEVSSYQKLALTNDLAIIANRFNLGGSGGFTTSTDRRLWLIVPDTTPGKTPTCAANQSFAVGGGFTFDSKLDVMIYSPCRVDIGSSTVITGQIFSGQASVAGGSTVNFTAVGLPGWNLTTGLSTTTPVTPADPSPAPTETYTESDRTVVSSRIVTESN